MTEKVTVLLGAGASVEAGLPGSRQLTQEVAERYRVAQNPQTLRTLNAVAGAMIAFDASRGGSAFEALDVERLFSAVEMLADRESVELTPFVASWQPGIEGTTKRGLPSFFGRNVQKAVFDTTFGTQAIERLFSEGVRALSGGSPDNAFADLRDNLVLVLREVLLVDPSKTNYLLPLVQHAASDNFLIATLNYDLALETAAKSVGLTVDTGISTWPGGLDWEWTQGGETSMRLLKLHGSIDWVYEQSASSRVRGVQRERAIEQLDLTDERSLYSRRPPGLIFGQRGRLRSEGPFLAMLLEFARALESTDRIIIVGYSLRDTHINSVIRTWYTRKPGRRVTLVDPGLPMPDVLHTWDREKHPGFMIDLIEEMYEKPDWSTPQVTHVLKPGHQVERCGAGIALQALFAD